MAAKPYRAIERLPELEDLLLKEEALLVYFPASNCQVCKVLKPKVAELVANYFPQMAIACIDISLTPEIAAQNRVFTAPTVIVFFAGKEYIRKSRGFSLDELKKETERIYLRMFPETL